LKDDLQILARRLELAAPCCGEVSTHDRNGAARSGNEA
jgi:hypothetical protein